MENNNFFPMPTPPPEIAKALGWRTPASSEDVEAEEFEQFQRANAISNPWTAKPALKIVDEEAQAEKEFEDSIAPVKKLFQPKEPAGQAPALGSLPNLPEEPDAEERELYSPVHKLFHPGVSVTPAAASNVEFTKRATPPALAAPKEKSTLTYKKHRDENGLLWSEGYSADGALQSYMLVIDETED
jgi:hypothetical protein